MYLWVVGYEVWSETHGPAIQPVRVVAARDAAYAIEIVRATGAVPEGRALRAEKVEAINVAG